MNRIIRIFAAVVLSLSAGMAKAEVDSVARAMASQASSNPAILGTNNAWTGRNIWLPPSVPQFLSVDATSTDGLWVAPAWGISPHPEWGDVPGDFTRNSVLFRCLSQFDAKKAEYCVNFDNVVDKGASPTWRTGIVYPAGQNITYGTNLYTTVAGGTSGATPPTCTSGTCSDGGITWTYVNKSIVNNKVGIGIATLAKTNAGTTWNLAAALTFNSPLYYGSWATNVEFDHGVGYSQDCAIGFCNAYDLYLSGNTAGTSTASIGISESPNQATAWSANTVFLPRMIIQADAYPLWATATVYGASAGVIYGSNRYTTVAGGTSGASPPTCTVGTCSDGAVTWTYAGTAQRLYEAGGNDNCTTGVTRPTGTGGPIADGTCNWYYQREGTTGWAMHYGIFSNGINSFRDAFIADFSSPYVGVDLAGTYATAGIRSTGVIQLVNATSNSILMTTAGVAAPGASSAGQKIQLYGNVNSPAASDYAIGVEAGFTWFSSGGGYKFYDSAAGLQAAISSGGIVSSNGLTLTGAASDLISFGLNGVNPPGAASTGAKVQLLGASGVSAVSDYAIGVEAGFTWFSTGGGYKFYDSAGATKVTISSAGLITTSGGLAVSGNTGLSVTKTVRASGGAADCTLIYTGGILTGGTC